MTSLKKFARVFAKSCYDMEFYRGVRMSPWTQALKYFIRLHVLVAAIMSLALFLPGMLRLTGEVRAYVAKFPAEASFEMKEGRFSTNLVQPYVFAETEVPVIIDTSVEGTDFPALLKERATKDGGLLVGRDAIFIMRGEAELRTMTMKDYPNVTLTRADVDAWLVKYSWLAVIGMTLLFLLASGAAMTLSNAGYAMLMAWLAMLAARLWKVRLTFAQWAAICLHAVTLPLIVMVGLVLADIQIPYAFTFILAMFLGAVIMDERQRPVEQPPKDEPPASVE